MADIDVGTLRALLTATDNMSPVVRKVSASFDDLNNTVVKSTEQIGTNLQNVTTTFDQAGNQISRSVDSVKLGLSGFQTNIIKDWANQFDISSKNIMSNLDRLGLAFSGSEDQEKMFVNTVTGDFVSLDDAMNQMTDATSRFNFAWLGIMFSAMQAERIFGGLLGGIFTNYMNTAGAATYLGQATIRLQAAWNFLGFTLMTAIEPILLPIITWFTQLLNMFSSLPQPVQQAIVVLLGVAAALSAIIVAVGAFNIFWQSAFGAGGLAGSVNTFSSSILSLGPIIAGFALIALAAILIIQGGWDHFNEAFKLNQQATIAAAEGNWTNYKMFVLGQNIEMVAGIQAGFVNLGNTILVALNYISYGVASVFNGIIDFILGGIQQLLVDLGQKPSAAIQKAMADANTQLQNDFTNNMSNLAAETAGKMATINQQTVDQLIQQGFSKTDLLNMGYNIGQVIRGLNDLGYSTKQYTTYLSDLSTHFQSTTDATTKTTNATQQLNQYVAQSTDKLGALNTGLSSTKTQMDSMAAATNNAISSLKDYGASIAAIGGQQAFTALQQSTSSYAISSTPGILQGGQQAIKAPPGLGGGYEMAFSTNVSDFVLAQGRLLNVDPNDILMGVKPGNVANNNTNMGGITVNVTTGPISNAVDIRNLANTISNIIMNDIKSSTVYRRKGAY